MTGYRHEVDGLRAVAVLVVMLFHAGFAPFAGGFVGVDVFFVISGFLITGIIVDDLRAGRFSFRAFYLRRARRILPALFVVLAACLPFAFLWMPPVQLQDFGTSLVSTVLAWSNLHFAGQIGYFAPDADLQPLLHSWSLSVEEQFYLGFPLLLWLVYRWWPRAVWPVVAGLALASLAYAEWALSQDAGRAFFLLPPRIWELATGALAALAMRRWAIPASDLGGAAGLLLIAGSVVVLDRDSAFPGVAALAPVIGTALVLVFARAGTWSGRLLSLRPMVAVGLISYSAYLWHQPLLAFARLRSLDHPGPLLLGAMLGLALILAAITWHLVEEPFRRRRIAPSGRAVVALAGTAAVALVAVGLTVRQGQGWDGRFSPAVLAVLAADRDKGADDCYFYEDRFPDAHPVDQCRHPDSRGKVRVLLLGDSHGAALSQELGAALRAADIGYYDMAYSGCVPLRGFRRFDKDLRHRCADFVEGVMTYAESAGIEVVALTGRFPLYLTGRYYDNGEGGVEDEGFTAADLADRTDSAWDAPGREARVLAAYESRLREIASRFSLVLVHPIPETGWHVPDRAFRALLFNGDGGSLTTSYDRYRDRVAPVAALFDRLVATLPNVYAARVQDALCDAATGRCRNADAEGVFYYDNDHPTNAGARRMAPVIVAALQAALADRSRQAATAP